MSTICFCIAYNSSIFSLFNFTHKTQGYVLPKSNSSYNHGSSVCSSILESSLNTIRKAGWLCDWSLAIVPITKPMHMHSETNSRVIIFSVKVSFSSWQKYLICFLELMPPSSAIPYCYYYKQEKKNLLISISQIHPKYFRHFVLYSFLIQPFQLKKTEK